jgi:hypothetical protein
MGNPLNLQHVKKEIKKHKKVEGKTSYRYPATPGG